MRATPSEWGLVNPGQYVADQSGTVWHIDAIISDSARPATVYLRNGDGDRTTISQPAFDRPVTVMEPTPEEVEGFIENFIRIFDAERIA